MKALQVAVGVVKNASGQVLISRRAPSLHQGGLWEFPGGKIEPGESPEQALFRELREELDVTVQASTPLITINHDYPDKSVQLHVFLVEHFQGIVKHCHGQPIQWVNLSELSRYRFPAANQPIITASRLPPRYAIWNDAEEAELFANLKKILAKGIKLIQARLKSLPKQSAEAYLAEASSLCHQQEAVLLINSDTVFAGQAASNVLNEQATRLSALADGMHLTSRHLRAMEKRPESYQWVAASCHNLQELLHAQDIGVDFAVLAPVLATATHPGCPPLGWDQFSALVAQVNMPVYALGGMSESCLNTARQAGGQGIAGIRAFLA
ncbi:MAG: Nudix family hydrolase [Methylosarcina sp.]